MTIAAPGLFILTFEGMYTDFVAASIESETLIKQCLVADSYTPNYSTHVARSSITAHEVTGLGYPGGGIVVTTTEFVIGSPASGQAMWDHADAAYPIMTVTDIMAAVDYINKGSAGADWMIALMDFVTAVDTDDGVLIVQTPATGVWYQDFTP